jgi:cytochrome P450
MDLWLFNPLWLEPFQMNLDPDNPRDFLDLMLLEHARPSKPDSCFASDLGKVTIQNVMLDLFIAGMETTSSSLILILLQLLHHPDIKEKVQQEIDRVIRTIERNRWHDHGCFDPIFQVVGKNRFPSFADKEDMHLTNAVLLESLRVASLVYIGLPHAANEDIKFEGYDIPKGTIIFGSIYHSMHDPKVFDDPDTFKPERFLSADGKFVHDDRILAFGTGKRVCLGQSLAEKEFFIFFTCLLQQFNIDPVPGKTLPSYKDIFPGEELFRIPKPYEVILTKRLIN